MLAGRRCNIMIHTVNTNKHLKYVQMCFRFTDERVSNRYGDDIRLRELGCLSYSFISEMLG